MGNGELRDGGLRLRTYCRATFEVPGPTKKKRRRWEGGQAVRKSRYGSGAVAEGNRPMNSRLLGGLSTYGHVLRRISYEYAAGRSNRGRGGRKGRSERQWESGVRSTS